MSTKPPDRRHRIPPLEWKFFAGACLLTGALLIPHAGLTPIIKGMGLAAVILGVWSWLALPR